VIVEKSVLKTLIFYKFPLISDNNFVFENNQNLLVEGRIHNVEKIFGKYGGANCR
jgi:hypothetical protein